MEFLLEWLVENLSTLGLTLAVILFNVFGNNKNLDVKEAKIKDKLSRKIKKQTAKLQEDVAKLEDIQKKRR